MHRPAAPVLALMAALTALSGCATTHRAGAQAANASGSGLGLGNASVTATSSGAPTGIVRPGTSPGGKHGGTSTSGRSGTTGGNAGSAPGSGTAGSTITGAHQGVTATTVKVGFIVPTGYSDYGKGAAFASPNFGDIHAEVKAMVAWINTHGGIGGRKVVAVTQDHDINNDSRTEEEGICTKFTEDEHVFAVVLAAQGYPETRRCYQQHHTLILDPTPFLYGADSFRALAPYYWSPNYVNYSRVMRALVPALVRARYFTGSYTLGVVTYDVDVYHSIVDNDLRPALKAAGITLDTSNVKYISNADIPTIQRGATQAVAQMQVAGVNRVIFAGLGPYAPLFMSTAESSHFTPRYAITSYDEPWFDQNWKAMNPGDQLKGAVGIGFAPVQDVADGQYHFPAAGEQPCLGVYAAAGIRFAQRQDAQHALAYCDALRMLQAAAAPLGGNLTVQTWAAAAARLGGSFQSATAFQTTFAGGRMDGGNGYRPLAFDSGCTCFTYAGGASSFG